MAVGGTVGDDVGVSVGIGAGVADGTAVGVSVGNCVGNGVGVLGGLTQAMTAKAADINTVRRNPLRNVMRKRVIVDLVSLYCARLGFQNAKTTQRDRRSRCHSRQPSPAEVWSFGVQHRNKGVLTRVAAKRKVHI